MPSDRVRRLEQLYGVGFPNPDMKDEDRLAEGWQAWIKRQVEKQRGVMGDKRLHWARHRLFRAGRQWISTRDRRQWREVNADENRIRAVFNMIGPALDFRIGMLQEQRPGFKHQPVAGGGIDGRERALAQQSVAEWHFRTQNIWQLILDALHSAQTDGVAWLNVYVDKSKGPIMEDVEVVGPDDERYKSLVDQGYEVRDSGLVEVPLTGTGDRGDPGTSPATFRGGQIRTRLIRAHETYADPEAWTISGADRRAKWFLIRRLRDLRSARIQLDDDKLEADVENVTSDPMDLASLGPQSQFQRGLPPFPSDRTKMPEGGVWENLIYFAPSEEFPNGKWVEVIGDRHLRGKDRLVGERIPIARVTDGSTDPDLYPRPVMSDWIGDQMSINALGSKILEYSRLHSGTRLMALEGTSINETFSDIVGSIVEYKGPKPDQMPAPRVSPDLWQMWIRMIRQLEDKTGWTDVARGQLTGEGGFQDIAGRAVLAARELFERQFGSMVRAAAKGASDWSELVVVHAQELYKTARLIPMTGRPDLAKLISADDLKGDPKVYVDPETLQPLPRALRNQLLTDYLQQGLISVDTFKKNAPFAEVRDLNIGDSEQWQRAQMVNTTLESRWEELTEMEPEELFDVSSGLAIFWQDSPDIHMQALEEIILDDKKPFPLRKLAADRWGIYSELAKSKEFPIELELQGVPRPPAPIEVVGVPNVVQQRAEFSQQTVVQGQDGGGGAPPGAAQGTSPAPESSPQSLPNTSTDQASPLGSFGAAEAAMQQ